MLSAVSTRWTTKMEESLTSLRSKLSEGEDVCIICVQKYTDGNRNNDIGALKNIQNVFSKVSKYLTSEPFEGCFQWNFIEQKSSPVCSSCYSSVENIFNVNDMIEKLQNTIEELINSFTCEVLGRHNRLKDLYTIENDSDKLSEEKTTDSNYKLDNDIDIVKEENDYIVAEVVDVDLLTVSEKLVKTAEDDEDFGIDDDFDSPNDVDEDDEPVNNSTKGSRDDIPKADYSLQYPSVFLKQLKIILTRLELVNPPVASTTSKNSARPKRKAAMAANESMKNIVKDLCQLPSVETHGTSNAVKTQDDRPRSRRKSVLAVRNIGDTKWRSEFENSQSESEYSDSSGSERLVKRRKDRPKIKTSQRTRIFEVAKRFRCRFESCKLSFNFTKELKSHSSASGHINDSIYKCNKNCSEIFFNKTELKNHVKFHHNRSSFRCKSCPKIFKEKESLNIHQNIFHAEKLFKCNICNEEFGRKLNISQHKILHSNKYFKCELCSKKFIWKISLKLHVNAKHIKEKYTCSLCSKVFTNRLQFSRHRLIHFKSKIRKIYPCTGCKKIHFVENIWDSCIINHFRKKDHRGFTCAICTLKFPNSKGLDYHSLETRHVNKKLFQCHVCKKRYYKYDNLSKCHRKVKETENLKQSGENPEEISLECSICFKKFKNKNYMRHHIKTHSTYEQFQCTHCELSFNLRDKLERHVLSAHTEDKPFACTKCDAKFKSNSYLSRHIKRHRNDPVFCDICGKKYADVDNLRTHLKLHEGSMHQCTYEFCERKFYDRSKLREHIKVVHTKEKQYSCEMCQKIFASNDGLTLHLRNHAGEKPFSCSQCEKKFTYRNNLKTHIDRMHAEKKFKCNHCDKYFSGKDILKSHVDVVHGEKKFQCQFCPYLCRLKHHLNSHIEAKHSGERPFVCDICGKAFARKDVLGGHIKWHNKMKAKEKE